MSTKKLLQAAAGNSGSGPPDVDDVFSCHLYSGTGSSRSINNGIDLAGEGGLVWGKGRSNQDGHWLVDSERGIGSNNNFKYLRSENTGAEIDLSIRSLSSFNSDGFTFQAADAQFNASSIDYVTWTFRKSKKFFDVVTYTGDGSSSRAISHGLDCVPGMIIIKSYANIGGNNGGWPVMHNYGTANLSAAVHGLNLNRTDNNQFGNNVTSDFSSHVTSTTFNPYEIRDTGYERQNISGVNYVAYLFAHNTGDGIFGPNEDQDIIKCGKYVGNNASQEIDVGFEPQWILIKNTTDASNWGIFDTKRFWFNQKGSGDSKWLVANSTDVEGGIARFYPTNTGFGFTSENGIHMNSNYAHYIYVAIRKGQLSPPESASEVFDINYATTSTGENANFRSTNQTDFAIYRNNRDQSGYPRIVSRLTGERKLLTNANDAESNDSNTKWDYNTGFRDGGDGLDDYAWMWKRAPKFCDVVCWIGTSSARTIQHHLEVAPEMIWVRARNIAEDFTVYHKDTGNGRYLELNSGAGRSGSDSSAWWNSTTPTSSVFSVGTHGRVNANGNYYIAYLFTTLAGISKVGTFTATGSALNVDCGFSSGAKLVIVKRTDTSGDWYLWDSTRGLVSGNDPYLLLNSTSSETTNTDYIDPHPSGFTMTTQFFGSGDFIFYAVAA